MCICKIHEKDTVENFPDNDLAEQRNGDIYS